jgi:hypothetical protein
MGNYCCSRLKEDCFRLSECNSDDNTDSMSKSSSSRSLQNFDLSNRNYHLSNSNLKNKQKIEYSSMFISPLNTPSPPDIISGSISSSNQSIDSFSNSVSMTSSTELEVA